MSGRRPRVLFISPDPVGAEMAGLGIRYSELARAIAPDADAIVATGAGRSGGHDGVQVEAYRPHAPEALRALIAAADLVLAPPQWPVVSRWLRASRARVVHDLYTPEALEALALFAGRARPVRRLMVGLTLDRLHDALRTAHHLVCASERQRDLWLGALLAERRIGEAAYDRDPTLRGVIDLLPFGTPVHPPAATGTGGARERLALGEDVEVVLWNGGIWGWLDASTAIRAVAALHARRPSVRLVFMGTSPHPAGVRATEEARAVAARCGVLDSAVVFHSAWVPYRERADWLLDADCALSTHADHLEARFAFRTRVLDCLWARLPVVCTAGDDLAARVARDELGAVVAPGDAEGAAAALERVLDTGRPAYAKRLAQAAAELSWPRVAEPLLRWAREDGPRPPRLAAPGAARRTPAHGLRAALYVATRPAIARLGLRAPRA